jgi:hypothetical protein
LLNLFHFLKEKKQKKQQQRREERERRRGEAEEPELVMRSVFLHQFRRKLNEQHELREPRCAKMK